ncbi:hypothetical protein OO012_20190, partial [Rhodobacteraceae bacterium KMM 6894]|nr:hypothetical protein [Rhodobacteraceae bacterium KMM 6894]
MNKELEQILLDEFDKFDTDELKYSVSDLVEKLSNHNIRVSSSRISEIMKKVYKMETVNSTYKKYHLSVSPMQNKPIVEEMTYKGRHYSFKRGQFA